MKKIGDNSKFSKFLLCTSSVFLTLVLMGASGCQKTKKIFKPVTKVEKAKMQMASLQDKKKALAPEDYLRELERAVSASPSNIELKYELADLCLELHKYKQAAEMYRFLYTLYPADTRCEYAKYREILALYTKALGNSKECDTTELEDAIRMCDAYIADSTLNTYNAEIVRFRARGRERLLDKAICVFNQHIRRNNIVAAQNRLKLIEKEFIENEPGIKPRIHYLEHKLATYKKDEETAKLHLSELLNQHPDSLYTRMAEGVERARKHVFSV